MASIPWVESQLITRKALSYLDSRIGLREIVINSNAQWVAPRNSVVYSPDGKLVASDQAGVIRIWDAASGRLLSARRGDSENFLRIGHALLAWIVAWLGGRISAHPLRQESDANLGGDRPVGLDLGR